MSYLKEISEIERKRRTLTRKQIEKQNELQREELKTKKQEPDDKRNQNEAMHQRMMMQQQLTTAVTCTATDATAISCYDGLLGQGTCCQEVMIIT